MIEILINPRFWTPLACNYVLLVALGFLNHTLSSTGLSLWAVGVLPFFLCLNLPGVSGFVGVLLSGLLVDASMPTPYGLFSLVFASCHIGVQFFRNRVHRENVGQFLLLSQLVNALCFLLLSFDLIQEFGASRNFWVQAGVNFAVSTVSIVALAPWYLDLQRTILQAVFGIRIFEEDLR